MQWEWPHPHKNSTDAFIASQWGQQNFSLSAGVQLQAGLPHFFSVAKGCPPSVRPGYEQFSWDLKKVRCQITLIGQFSDWAIVRQFLRRLNVGTPAISAVSGLLWVTSGPSSIRYRRWHAGRNPDSALPSQDAEPRPDAGSPISGPWGHDLVSVCLQVI